MRDVYAEPDPITQRRAWSFHLLYVAIIALKVSLRPELETAADQLVRLNPAITRNIWPRIMVQE